MKKTTSKFTIAALAAALVLGGGYASGNQFDASAETPSVVAAEGDAVVADAAPAEDAEAITTTTTAAQAEDTTTTTTTVAATTAAPATAPATTATQAAATTTAAATTKAAATTAKTTTKAVTTSNKKGSPKTGDAFPALGLTAVIGAAGLVGLATRKKDS